MVSAESWPLGHRAVDFTGLHRGHSSGGAEARDAGFGSSCQQVSRRRQAASGWDGAVGGVTGHGPLQGKGLLPEWQA